MAKETVSKPKATEAVVCQCCKKHVNNPSTCTDSGKYIPRKSDASKCEKFSRTK